MQTPPLVVRSSTGASLHLVSSSDTASSVPRALSSTQSPTPVTGGTEYSVILEHIRTEITMEVDRSRNILAMVVVHRNTI